MKFKGLEFPDPIWADTIEPKEMTWLWFPYIPAAAATMIFGPGGTGKSHIAVDIAARVSRGDLFPGQETALPAQKVLMLSAEDEPDTVMTPRLIKAGADLKNVALINEPITLNKTGLEVIDHFISKFALGIVFIDPVVSYIGSKVDINRANETREFTGGLHQIAKASGVPIVIVHHARKGSEGADYDRMMGSADFNNAVRSVLYTTLAPNGDKIMKHVKANYSKLGSTLRYDFGDRGFEWLGSYDDKGLATATKGQKRSEAADWLREQLKDGPVRSVTIEQRAEKQGYNHRTLQRAKAGVAESYLEAGENGKMQWWMRLIDDQNDAEVPVMGKQWGPERLDRTSREVIARENARTKRPNAEVDDAGSASIDDLMDRMLK